MAARGVTREEYLGEDESGREYWFEGGHIYLQPLPDDPAPGVCSLAAYNRLRKLRARDPRGRVASLAA